jgi:hypothetical protein
MRWVLVALLGACATNSSSDHRVNDDPRVAVAAAYCAYMDRCFPTEFASSYGSEAHCDDVMVMFLAVPPAGTMSTCADDFDAAACVGSIVAPESCAPFGFVKH